MELGAASGEDAAQTKSDDFAAAVSSELSLTDRVRALYEDGVVPVRQVVRITGVGEHTLYKCVCSWSGFDIRDLLCRILEPRMSNPNHH